jgi:hypothetical protein
MKSEEMYVCCNPFRVDSIHRQLPRVGAYSANPGLKDVAPLGQGNNPEIPLKMGIPTPVFSNASKRLRHPAQGCGTVATLGNVLIGSNNPDGVASNIHFSRFRCYSLQISCIFQKDKFDARQKPIPIISYAAHKPGHAARLKPPMAGICRDWVLPGHRAPAPKVKSGLYRAGKRRYRQGIRTVCRVY